MPAKILVVDDERPIVESLAMILKSAGYEVRSTISPVEAVALNSEFCPDLLLTDVSMPDMNGFELALRIKSECPGCRLLFFSGQATTNQLAEGFNAKFTQLGFRFELLAKPLHPTVLLKRIEESLVQAA